jgi:hypothetical protein
MDKWDPLSNEYVGSKRGNLERDRFNQVLPSYSGCNAKCIKCGEIDAYSKYRVSFFSSAGTELTDERIQRECKNCEFKWEERPLNWEGPKL